MGTSGNDDGPDDDNGSDGDDSHIPVSELVLVPAENAGINLIYEAIKQCQLLNPDPNDMDEDDENVNMYEDADVATDDDDDVDYRAAGDGGTAKILKCLVYSLK